ncbi:hypothetical protein AV530_000596 [Patagioenas fasciata monilis]|uniref:Uncharacterized protein n=1 Tax=Patagioenas fasciata monilis TaxID=372326 RepID=A0A1V4IH46_PATFA|nr:hypothetical protein AV530_000596 [Patagioenas fasciata monilis]
MFCTRKCRDERFCSDCPDLPLLQSPKTAPSSRTQGRGCPLQHQHQQNRFDVNISILSPTRSCFTVECCINTSPQMNTFTIESHQPQQDPYGVSCMSLVITRVA